MNIEDFSLGEFIQIDFVKFETKHFDEFNNGTLKIFRDYGYPHRFWINLKLGFNKTYNTIILKVVAAKLNNK